MRSRVTWKAKGLIAPLWHAYGERHGLTKTEARGALAKEVGTTTSVLSSINSGERRLGRDLAEKLAQVCGVTLIELGARAELARPEDLPILERLSRLEDEYAKLARKLDENTERLAIALAGLQDPPEDPPGDPQAEQGGGM